VEPEPPDGRATVVGHHTPSDTEQPQPVFWSGRGREEAAPGDREDLSDDVAGVMLANTAVDVAGDCLAMGSVEGLEPALAVHLPINPWHSTGLRSLSLTQLHGRDNAKTVAPVRTGGGSYREHRVLVAPRWDELGEDVA